MVMLGQSYTTDNNMDDLEAEGVSEQDLGLMNEGTVGHIKCEDHDRILSCQTLYLSLYHRDSQTATQSSVFNFPTSAGIQHIVNNSFHDYNSTVIIT